ncbi:MAG: biotin-dependent carboxyltransferase family protein [Psychroserpens sp.]|uniref:5-oxoprolinase subunit C family protein n=1 Tax=Psychroserpens sp. TaxID=2020870 RepID=UPI003001D805
MVKVIKTGLYDTVQDVGRLGFQEYGVPISGVMDSYSAALGNSILGNNDNAAVIECVVSGPQLQFIQDTMICITGADMSATINTSVIKNNTVVAINSGDTLKFGKLNYGCRAYISVLGGFQTEEKMRSRSMYGGVTSAYKLVKGDILPILDIKKPTERTFSTIKVNNKHFDTKDLDAFTGPEFDKLDTSLQKTLFNTDFTISKDSNRMAYQFNEPFDNALEPIITSLVLPGTVQLTPSGQLMVLMRDCQTTGGYPRILQLTESSINSLSQMFFSNKIRFKRLK